MGVVVTELTKKLLHGGGRSSHTQQSEKLKLLLRLEAYTKLISILQSIFI